MEFWSWFYLIVTLAVAGLCAFLPARSYERKPRWFIAALLTFSCLCAFFLHPSPVNRIYTPVFILVDLLILLIVYKMHQRRPSADKPMLMFLILAGSLMSLFINTLAYEVRLFNIYQLAVSNNIIYLFQLGLVVFLSIEYMLNKRGLIGHQPINYFKLARETRENASSGDHSRSRASAWREPEHRYRRR